jgi:hypothetical protein
MRELLLIPGIAIIIITLGACSDRMDSLSEFTRAARDYEKLLLRISAKQHEVKDLADAYNQASPKNRRCLLDFTNEDATEDNTNRVLSLIDSETDESLKTILTDIGTRLAELNVLRESARDCAASLPPARRVRKGDNHYRICMSYLREDCGLPRRTADSIIASVELCCHLLEGQDVWLLYTDGAFATFVTKGESPVFPAAARSVVKLAAVRRDAAGAAEEAFEQVLDSLRYDEDVIRSAFHSLTR